MKRIIKLLGAANLSLGIFIFALFSDPKSVKILQKIIGTDFAWDIFFDAGLPLFVFFGSIGAYLMFFWDWE